jgi:hypothetical protein
MKRSVLILSSLLVVLILAAYLLLQKQGEQDLSVDASPLFVPIDSSAVNMIDIVTPKQTIRFEKEGTDWFLKEPLTYKADNSSINGLLHEVKGLRIKSIASSNTDKHSLFKVDSSGIRVTLFEHGNEKASFYVGKSGPSYTDTYVRKASSNDVVLVDAQLSYTFSKPVKEWRDKTIFSVPQQNITGVNFQYGDTTFTLLQSGGAWLIGKDSTKESNVTSLLSSLSKVTADDFLDTTNAATIRTQAQLSYGGGSIRFAFDTKANKYYVQSSLSPQWFVLEAWKVNQMLKRKKDLIK